MKRTVLSIFVVCSLSSFVCGDDFEPINVDAKDFTALIGQSPFNRTLNLSGSLVLTGIAKIDDRRVVTLLDTETKKSFVVSDQPNQQGWKMVDINTSNDLELVTAKISVSGEVMNIRYAENTLKPGESRPGGGSTRTESEGSSQQSGKRRGPPEDVRQKIGAMSEEQRNKFFTKMREFQQKNPDMNQEDRQNASRKLLEKIAKKSN